MANSPAVNTAVLPAAPAAAVTVDSLILEAGESSKTMYAKIKAAAALAAPGMDKTKTPKEQVELMLAAHAVALTTCGDHNIKAIFTSLLWLYAAPAAVVVEVPVAGSPDKAVAQVAAAAAVNQSQNTMRAAATQVREQCGAARKTGGGRKPNAGGGVVVITPGAGAGAPTFFDTLDTMLKSPADCARIIAVLERNGYKVSRADKVVPVAAPAAEKPIASALAQAAAAVAKGSKGAAAILAATK